MNRFLPLLFAVIFLFSCNNAEKTEEKKPENDMDAASSFLNACLQGHFSEASNYMLQDSTNTGYLFLTEKMYNNKTEEDKKQLKEASLHFYNYPNPKPNDSTTIIIFSNSYKNKKDTLRVIRTGGRWLVDLKYLFLHDIEDSTDKIIGAPSEKNSKRDTPR